MRLEYDTYLSVLLSRSFARTTPTPRTSSVRTPRKMSPKLLGKAASDGNESGTGTEPSRTTGADTTTRGNKVGGLKGVSASPDVLDTAGGLENRQHTSVTEAQARIAELEAQQASAPASLSSLPAGANASGDGGDTNARESLLFNVNETSR